MGDRVETLMQSLSLYCPDDGAELRRDCDALRCHACGRTFPIQRGMFVELLPTARTDLPGSTSKYTADYAEAFDQPFAWDETAVAWGAPETFPPHWVQRRERQVAFARDLLVAECDPKATPFVDLSGGAGYYSMAYAATFGHVVHCDLSVDNLNYTMARAERRGLGNMVFLRIDYFRPPFQANVDRLLCFDTLIRGEEHERMLLASINKCLSPDGAALVDFHNWWHNPARRVGLLKKNFPRGSYSRRQLAGMLAETGVGRAEFFPWCQEFEQSGIVGKIGAKIIPATRLVYRCRGTPGRGQAAKVR